MPLKAVDSSRLEDEFPYSYKLDRNGKLTLVSMKYWISSKMVDVGLVGSIIAGYKDVYNGDRTIQHRLYVFPRLKEASKIIPWPL